MNKNYTCIIICFMFAFMLFFGYFFYLLTDKLKNQLIAIMVHAYFSLRQYLVALNGFLRAYHGKLCLLVGCIKNKIACLFDPRIRDSRNIIINASSSFCAYASFCAPIDYNF